MSMLPVYCSGCGRSETDGFCKYCWGSEEEKSKIIKRENETTHWESYFKGLQDGTNAYKQGLKDAKKICIDYLRELFKHVDKKAYNKGDYPETSVSLLDIKKIIKEINKKIKEHDESHRKSC